MFSTPETSIHVRDENREISPLEREEGYGERIWRKGEDINKQSNGRRIEVKS